jgi:hypothetical protein
MGILSSKPASEIDVLRAVELKAIALGSKLDTGHDLLILAAAAIKAENQRVNTPGGIRRIEVSCLLWKMLQLIPLASQPRRHRGSGVPAQQAGQRRVRADACPGAC